MTAFRIWEMGVLLPLEVAAAGEVADAPTQLNAKSFACSEASATC